jgi:phosphoglycolate phosphatase
MKAKNNHSTKSGLLGILSAFTFIVIAVHLGGSVDRFLFVGDSVGDLRTSEAAGMMPVGVSWGYGLRDRTLLNGETLIQHPRELLNLL